MDGKLIMDLFSVVKEYAVGIYQKFNSELILINGASLAFGLLICLIPWMLLLFSALGFFLTAEESMETVINNVNQLIPLPGYDEQISNQLRSRLEDLVDHRQAAGIIGLLGVFWLSTFLFGNARTILNNIYHIRIRKHYVVRKLKDFQLLLIVGTLFVVALFGTTSIFIIKKGVMEFFQNLPINTGFVRGILPIIIGFLFTWLMFFLLYRFLPTQKLSIQTLLISTTVGALLWEVGKIWFGIYISNYSNITRVYGALTIFAGTAMWLYYSAIAFLVGGAAGQLYRERNKKPKKNNVA